jgi:hypothetical protein
MFCIVVFNILHYYMLFTLRKHGCPARLFFHLPWDFFKYAEQFRALIDSEDDPDKKIRWSMVLYSLYGGYALFLIVFALMFLSIVWEGWGR